VERLAIGAVGQFFAFDHQEFLAGAMQRVEAIDRRQEVVIGQYDELVTMLPVPTHDVVRCAVAIAVQGVGVGVAFEPPIWGSRR